MWRRQSVCNLQVRSHIGHDFALDETMIKRARRLGLMWSLAIHQKCCRTFLVSVRAQNVGKKPLPLPWCSLVAHDVGDLQNFTPFVYSSLCFTKKTNINRNHNLIYIWKVDCCIIKWNLLSIVAIHNTSHIYDSSYFATTPILLWKYSFIMHHLKEIFTMLSTSLLNECILSKKNSWILNTLFLVCFVPKLHIILDWIEG